MKHAGIDHALREVAKRRDEMLGMLPTLSPARRAILTETLAGKFPVESLLHEAAMRRDQLLGSRLPAIPSCVESALHSHLQAGESAGDGTRRAHPSDWTISASIWRKVFRSPVAAVLTAGAMIAIAFLCLDKWGDAPRSVATESVRETALENLEPGAILNRPWIGRAELFNREIAIGPFNLNTSEPASLETSFVANSRIQLADGIETPLGLRLDLPVRAVRLQEGLTRTP